MTWSYTAVQTATRYSSRAPRPKAEGKIVWYTSLSGVYRDLVEAFKRNIPISQSRSTAAAVRISVHDCSRKRKRDVSSRKIFGMMEYWSDGVMG